MFVSLDHLPALQVFLSDANHGAKREAIAQATLNGASQSELDTFLARPQTTDSFLAFTAAVDARRSELPLIVRNHIRHLLHNPILAVAPEGYHAPLEPLCAPPHSPPLPDELWYVLSRLGESESLSLRNGWTIESARRSREVTQAYAARAATEGVRSVWCDGGARRSQHVRRDGPLQRDGRRERRRVLSLPRRRCERVRPGDQLRAGRDADRRQHRRPTRAVDGARARAR